MKDKNKEEYKNINIVYKYESESDENEESDNKVKLGIELLLEDEDEAEAFTNIIHNRELTKNNNKRRNFSNITQRASKFKNIPSYISKRYTINYTPSNIIDLKESNKIFRNKTDDLEYNINNELDINKTSIIENLNENSEKSSMKDEPIDEKDYVKQQLMQKYESLDYDGSRNQPYYNMLDVWYNEYEFYFYLQLTFLGIIVAVGMFLMETIYEYLTHFKDLFLDLKHGNHHIAIEENIYGISLSIITSLTYALIVSMTIVFYSKSAGGGGIAEIKAYLNGVNVRSLITVKTGFSKLVLTAFTVASGMYVGIEGPMIHVGASLGAFMANMPGLEQWMPDSEFPLRFRNDSSKRDLLSCGAAAGVVAGFLSPMGGVMFALEEASTFWTIKMTLRTIYLSIVTSVSIYIAVGIYNVDDRHVMLKFGEFEYSPLISIYEWPLLIILGIVCGLIGGIWNVFAKCLMEWRYLNIMNNRLLRILEVLLLCLICTSIRIIIPLTYNTCKPMNKYYNCDYLKLNNNNNNLISNKMEIGEFVEKNCELKFEWMNLNCKEDEYNPISTLFVNSYSGVFKNLFHNKDPFGVDNLLLFASITFTLVLLIHFTAVPMGLFMPCMLIGAALGRAYGETLRNIFDLLGNDFNYMNPGLYALIGAASMVTGVTRLVLTVVVVFYELTDRTAMCVPILLSVSAAKLVADYLSIGIYDIILEFKHIPYIELSPHYDRKKRIRAKHIMSKPVAKLMSVEKVSTIVDMIENLSHNGFPVISIETGTFRGVITKNILITILNEGKAFCYLSNGDIGHEYDNVLAHLNQNPNKNDELHYYKFNENYQSKITVVKYKFIDKTDMWVDLRPYLQQGALSLNQDTPVERIFELFRAFGTRHLTICDDYFKVTGIVTRKDIMSDYSNNLY